MSLFAKAKKPAVAPVRRGAMMVLGLRAVYHETGEGHPMVFLNSDLGAGSAWLRVLPFVAEVGRCIAVDPVGFGESDRPFLAASEDFTFDRQQAYFDYFMESRVGDEPVTLVLSGLASVLGFVWASRNEERVRSICHMESVFRPIMWPDLDGEPRETLKQARTSDGERFVLNSNDYFTRILSEHLAAQPSPEARNDMLRLFGLSRDARLATLATLRDFPVNGYPTKPHATVQRYTDWFAETAIPKLLILGEPGYLVTGRLRASALKLPNQRVVAVHGKHVLAIDSPSGVGRFLAAWMRTEVLLPAR